MNQRADRSLKRDAAFRHVPVDHGGGRASVLGRAEQRIGQAGFAQANQRRDECRRVDAGVGRRDRLKTGQCRGENRLRDAGPEQLEQGAGGRRLQAVVLPIIGHGDADQMQIADGAGGGDVEQALIFMLGALGFQFLQIIVGGCLAISCAFLLHRRDQQVLVAIGAGDFVP